MSLYLFIGIVSTKRDHEIVEKRYCKPLLMLGMNKDLFT